MTTDPVLEKRLPIGSYRLVTLSVTQPNTDIVIPHDLASDAVRFQVVDATSGGVVYRGIKASTSTYIVLRATLPGTYRVQLFLEAREIVAPTVVSPTAGGIGSDKFGFNGLYLRTHPDSDKAANQVALIRADQIVTDKGTVVSPRSMLTADVTAAVGPGGLDSGSRVASTWYRVYYIFAGSGADAPDSPSTPTKDALILSRAKNYLLDQSRTTLGTATAQGLNDTTSEQIWADTFTPANAGSLVMMDVQLKQTGTVPTSTVKLNLYTDNAGVPGTILATADALSASGVATAGIQTIRFIFRTPFRVLAGTKYWFGVVPSYPTSAANFLQVNTDSSSTTGRAWNGTAWVVGPGRSLWFKEYVVQNDQSLILPPGYTESCQIGWVYNTSSNALVAFSQLGRRTTQQTQTFVSGGAATLLTLVDVSSFLPPLPLRVAVGALGQTAGDMFLVNGLPGGFVTADLSFRAIDIASGLPSTGLSSYPTPLPTEYQAVYYERFSGTGTIILTIVGYEW